MSWNNAAVTNAGVALLNESLAGHILTITSAVGGAGTLEDQELATAADVVDQKQTFSLMGLEDLEQGKQVGIQISNKGVSESYILHQIGVKAKLEYEDEETLLFLLQDDRGVEIPSEAENPDFLFEVYATIAISNKANITINVNPHVVASVEYVKAELQKKADQDFSNLTDPQMALYNLGACVRPNLLDNWYFVSGGIERTFPINQKGITSTGDVEKNTVCIDRWKRGDIDGIFTLAAAGLVSDGLNRTHIYQILEPDYLYGKTVTFSAWTNLGVAFGTTTIPTAQEWPNERKIIPVYEDDSVCLKVILLAEPKRVQIQPEAKTALTLKAVKLEIGKTQTLAYKGPLGFWNLLDIPDYTTELLKCQRYMVVIKTSFTGNVNFPVNIGMAMSANNAFIPIELPVPMRTTPALSVSGQFCLGTGNGEVDATLTFGTANDVNCVLLNAAASGLTPGQAVYLRAKNDATAKLILNANL